MLGLENLYSKISYNLSTGSKALSNAGLTPPSPFCGKFNNTNLAPLAYDTVSFTGRGRKGGGMQNHRELSSSTTNGNCFEPETDDDVKIYAFGDKSAKKTFMDDSAKRMDYRAYGIYKDLLPLASDLHKEAKKLHPNFEIKMSIFDSLVESPEYRSTGSRPIAEKTIRLKSTQSIAKKMAVKGAELIRENDDYPVTITRSFVKSEIHDLLGARLILSRSTPAEANAIIKRLIQSIETGNGPKILKIKNYGTHDYISKPKLDKLEKASYKAFGHFPATEHKKKTSGYTATHIIIELANGIDAEIQILGRGVARVKEIDDICYKGLQGKSIAGLPDVSRALKAISKNPKLKMEFDKYITSAYELARTKWDMMPDSELEKQVFPSINTEILPACLDLNNIEAALREKASKSDKKR